MEIVTGAMSTLLPKLAMLLTGEYKLQRSLRGEIKSLKAELESIQAVLEKVSSAPVSDEQVRIWARDVRELSYGIEDSVDKFMVHIDTNMSSKPQGSGGFISRSLRLLTTVRLHHKIAIEIIGIRELITEVAARRDRYKINSIYFSRSYIRAIEPRLKAIYEDTTELVGISGPQEELIALLMRPDATTDLCLRVASIVGIGGLGKTTLASAVYQQLRGQFRCHAFVSVSLNPDLNRILSSILRQISAHSYGCTETWEPVEIIDRIRLILRDKRYIVVLDDIWEKSEWEYIKCALFDNKCGSRIITTSRVLDVAESCRSEVGGAIYKLMPLSHVDSKKLFYKRIFCCEDGCHSELKEISEKIMKKCGGVPLAINAVASLLASKSRNINEWCRVYDSIGSGLEKSPSVENMRKVLSISYYGLPSQLKSCLLFLSIYPEDYSILRDQLVRRWISEGFIPGEDIGTLFEHAEIYFTELINRSLIEPEYIDTHGRVVSCRVHDMVLDLIKSLSCEGNFVTATRGQQSTDLLKRTRRLSLQNSSDGHSMLKEMNISHLRSLIVLPHATNLLPPLSCSPFLRVLDLEDCHDLKSHQIDGLMSLSHLRCLVMKGTCIVQLPKEIGSLGYLQTLDLRNTSISELPPTIVQLRKLVCLYIDVTVMLPVGFSSLKSLQALSFVGLSVSPNFMLELGNLTELRMLQISIDGIWYNSYEKSLTDSLCNMEKLHELRIHAYKVSTDFMLDLDWVPRYLKSFKASQLYRLPRWISPSLLCLCDIDMKLNILTQKDVQNLGALHFLLYLRLSVMKIEPETSVIAINHEGFQTLAMFSFSSNAMSLRFEQKAMLSNQNLQLAFRVQDTKDFYFGLENLFCLKHATIRMDCGGSSVDEVKDAIAAIQNGAFKNPNHPRLDVIKHFEDSVIKNDEKEKLQVHGDSKEADKEIIMDKMGPWGGNGGGACQIKVASHRLESVTICSDKIVDALAFTYLDKNGNKHMSNLWGGIGGSAHTICLGSSEFLMEVCGTFGPFFAVSSEVITSLTLVTNVRSYGPFGEPYGTPFNSQVNRNSSIVGFFGRSGKYIDAIGVYFRRF